MPVRLPDFDVFVSHASEDKEAVARPLVLALQRLGLRVWFDEQLLRLGDSLRERIDEGLVRSRFGVVILSPTFFRKPWALRELNALYSREVSASDRLILPVWHNLTHDDIGSYSPLLGDRLGALTSRGVEHVANQIFAAVRRPVQREPQPLVYSFGRIPGSRSLAAASMPGIFFPHHIDVESVHYEAEYPLGPWFELKRPKHGKPLFEPGDFVDSGSTLAVVFSDVLGADDVLAPSAGYFERYLVEAGTVVEFGQPVAEILRRAIPS